MKLPRLALRQPGSPVARSARSTAALALLVLGLASILLLARFALPQGAGEGGGLPDLAPPAEPAGWASSYLHHKADAELNARVDNSSRVHAYTACYAHSFYLAGSGGGGAAANSSEVEALLAAEPPRDGGGAQRFVEALVKTVPCSAEGPAGGKGCCQHAFHFRPNSTDLRVFRQVYEWHYMRYLYAVFDRRPPKYILDAGANAGFSAVLFKMLWPDAVVVAVEPDPGNFEALTRQVAGLEGVHPLNAALWGRKAKVAQVGERDGNWGKIFKALPPGQTAPGAVQAYSVPDIVALYKLPSTGFDFVKIDIEGAEGAVFDPGMADLSWVATTRVLSLEVHDYFASFFGMEEVSSRIDAVMAGHPEFSIVSDNEHVLYLSEAAVRDLPPLPPPEKEGP